VTYSEKTGPKTYSLTGLEQPIFKDPTPAKSIDKNRGTLALAIFQCGPPKRDTKGGKQYHTTG
jgi:hypothetical protein